MTQTPTMKRNQQQFKDEDYLDNMDKEHEEGTVGYCSYCKNIIRTDQEYKVKNGDFEHLDCWKEQEGIVDELKFD